MRYPDFSLTHQNAIVTGAGQGLGQGIAWALAHAGADVVVADLPSNKSRALETVAEIENMGRQARFVPVDVADVSSINVMAREAIEAFAQIHVLVNNAGVNIPKLALEVNEADWDKVLDIDLKGTFFCAQAIGRHMVEQRYGRVINITSQMGMVGYFNRSAYCSAKAGVVNLTRVLAVEWAKCGVTINTVAPTFLRTPLTEPMFQNKAFYEDVLSRIPMGRIGEIEDVVGAVIFLASGAASLITGHTLAVDGGWLAW